MIDGAKRYEMVRCPNPSCTHEFVRPREGRRTLPCAECGSDMLVLPMLVEPRPSTAQTFGIHAMRGALRAAAARTLQESSRAKTPRSRAMNAGRCEAYQDALSMLQHVIDTQQAAVEPHRPLSPALQRVVDDLVAEAYS